jgi:hypothetical protein
MYLVFPIAMRRVLELRDRFADKGGFDAVRIRLLAERQASWSHLQMNDRRVL